MDSHDGGQTLMTRWNDYPVVSAGGIIGHTTNGKHIDDRGPLIEHFHIGHSSTKMVIAVWCPVNELDEQSKFPLEFPRWITVSR